MTVLATLFNMIVKLDHKNWAGRLFTYAVSIGHIFYNFIKWKLKTLFTSIQKIIIIRTKTMGS